MHTFDKLKFYSKNFSIHIIILSFLNILSSLIIGIGLSYTLSQVIERKVQFVFVFLLLSLIQLFFSVAIQNIRLFLKQGYKTFLEDESFNHLNLIKNPLQIDIGKNVAVIRKTTESLSESLVSLLIGIPTVAFTILFSSVYAFILNPLVLLISVTFVILIMIFNHIRIKKLPELHDALNSSVNSLMAVQWELIRNREVSGFLNIDKVVSGFNNMTDKSAKKLIRANKYEVLATLFSNYGNIAVVVIVAVTGGILSMHGVLMLSELFALIILMPIISESLFSLPQQINTFSRFKGSIKTMDTLFELELRDEASEINFIDEEIDSIKVKIDNFAFYDKPLLSKINLNFTAGKLYVIKGESGCGKTTLLNIISKLIYAEKAVFVNNLPLNTINTQNYWKNIVYVSQKPFIMAGDMFFNISMSENPDKVLLNEALNFATISNKFNKNSSGEIQKIAIARAYYSKAKLWLLDEFTSSLDKKSEEQILYNLKQYIKNTNSIVIAVSHNEFVQQCADELIELDNTEEL